MDAAEIGALVAMPKRLYLSIGDEQFTAQVSADGVVIQPGDITFTVAADGSRVQAESEDTNFASFSTASGSDVWVTVDGEVFLVETRQTARPDRRSQSHGAFSSPMPATVVRIAVKPGDRVQTGDVLIALEAMKMELPIRAPRDGVVKAIHCREGELVQPDQELLEFD